MSTGYKCPFHSYLQDFLHLHLAFRSRTVWLGNILSEFLVTHNMKSLNLWIIFLGVSFAHLCASQHTCPQINVTTEDEEYYKKDLEFAFEGVLLVIVGVAGIFGNVAIVVMFAR